MDSSSFAPMGHVIPSVSERTPMGERSSDLISRLLTHRMIFLDGGVSDVSASIITKSMLFLNSLSKDPIQFVINSPGGSVYAGLSIYDTMQQIEAPVHTTVNGMAASMGAFLLNAGAAGFRKALPNARIMIHQPSGGSQGTYQDMKANFKELEFLHEHLNTIMAAHSGQTVEQIALDIARDRWMSAQEAFQYGLVDQIVDPVKKVEAPDLAARAQKLLSR